MTARTGSLTALLVALATAASVLPAGATHHKPARVAEGLWQRMTTGGTSLSVIVRFRSDEALSRAMPRFAGRPGIRLGTVPAIAVTATTEEIHDLGSDPDVAYVEHDDARAVRMDTATIASRARAVWGRSEGAPLKDSRGRVIDGRGVGVAVVDSGVADVPDLRDRIVKNFKVVANPLERTLGPMRHLIEVNDSDNEGHGTHVAGIVSSTGATSGGRYRGVAPGAGLYAFGAGETSIVTSFALAAFDWIVANHARTSPRIRVVNNSWGGDGPHDPESLVSIMTTALLAKGVVVVYAAGNGDSLGNGGTCSWDFTTEEAKHPSPGVISVAAYDDAVGMDPQSGTRNGRLAGYSSRGDVNDPSTWPDLSAPGAAIASTLNPHGVVSAPIKASETVEDAFLFALGPTLRHRTSATFRFGAIRSEARPLDFGLKSRPQLVYNAHRNRFMYTDGSPNASEVAEGRWYGPSDSGPVRSSARSTRSVGGRDELRLEHIEGPADTVSMEIASPSGTVGRVEVRFGCRDKGCAVVVRLASLFAGEPADGTWTVTPMPNTERLQRRDRSKDHVVSRGGTSMAAPHVAGVVALVLQANPRLSPAQVEVLLENTAHRFRFGDAYRRDPSNSMTPSSCDKGHGLVDAKAAVLAAMR